MICHSQSRSLPNSNICVWRWADTEWNAKRLVAMDQNIIFQQNLALLCMDWRLILLIKRSEIRDQRSEIRAMATEAVLAKQPYFKEAWCDIEWNGWKTSSLKWSITGPRWEGLDVRRWKKKQKKPRQFGFALQYQRTKVCRSQLSAQLPQSMIPQD